MNGLSQDESVKGSHKLLFESPGHRSNILGESYNEIGVGIEIGEYSGDFFQGKSYETMIATETYGTGSPTHRAITGVVFNDSLQSNDFYDLGEGVAGMRLIAERSTGERFETSTGVSGGYSLHVPAGTYSVFAAKANTTEKLVGFVDIQGQNVKLDVMPNRLNELFRTDTNSDGTTSPLDALLVINYLNRDQSQVAHAIYRTDLDVNRGGRIEPLDALIVINELNRQSVETMLKSAMPAEGERSAALDTAWMFASDWNDPIVNPPELMRKNLR